MINPNEKSHQQLVDLIRKMVSSLEGGKEKFNQFVTAYEKVIEEGRSILKQEWNVVKTS